MKSAKFTPFCYACGRSESAEGWKIVENTEKSSKIYETLCKDCLMQLSDSLLKDLQCPDKQSRKQVA